MSVIFEIIMVFCFGASWPFSIVKAYKARTAKGTSILFTSLIAAGYVAGIISKLIMNNWNYLTVLAFAFYIINLIMVSIGIAIYFRNKRLDKISQPK